MNRGPDPLAPGAAIALGLAAGILAAGCAGTPRPLTPPPVTSMPRGLPAFDGRDGTPLAWTEIIDRVADADAVFLGETHDDANGHAVEQAVVADVLARWPGAALSMEMLERDEQELVDDFLDGIIDADQLARLTFSTNWGAEGMWPFWYQPMLDSARDAGSPVIAANAPRRYVRLARTDGYERLDALPPDRDRLEDHPSEPIQGPYRDRFNEVMESMRSHPAEDAAEPDPEREALLDQMFRAQLVWDATMAASIAAALDAGAPKVVHVVGQFHCDFEGGTVQMLREYAPGVRVMVISLQPVSAASLRDEDRGRADVVVYTRESD